MWRMVCTGLLTLSISGCALFDNELNNRGGYLDYLADVHWFKADTKSMRLLRSYVLQASLARLAATSAKSSDDRYVIQARIIQANIIANDIYKCIQQENTGAICIFIDDYMVQYEKKIYSLAISALPIDEAKALIVSIGTANPASIIPAILGFAEEAFEIGRQASALYRDSIELEMVVAGYNLKQLATNGALSPQDQQLAATLYKQVTDAYAQGAGDLRLWKTTLASIKSQWITLFRPDAAHFEAVSALIQRACDQILEGSDAATDCKKTIQTGATPVRTSSMPALATRAKDKKGRVRKSQPVVPATAAGGLN